MGSSSDQPTAPFRDSGRGGAAMVIIDAVNRFDFKGGEALKANAQRIVAPILALRGQADAAEMPTIYVNDNFGEWHSDKSKLVESARETGGAFVERLAPRECDYFVLKPQLSAFYAANLPVLLPKLGVSRLVLTGVATDMCVLFTAGDAHMRDYALWVPEDAVASSDDTRAEAALAIVREQLGAETAPTAKLDLAGWIRALDAGE